MDLGGTLTWRYWSEVSTINLMQSAEETDIQA